MRLRDKIKFLIVLAVMSVVMICATGMTVFAEESRGDVVKVAHISDLHYYPIYMSYKESASDYSSSAFKRKSTTEMKLLAESGANLKATLRELEKQDLDILLVSGDLSSDGERQALIDVANALRKFQNDMRVSNADFQVLVTTGNHDVNNDKATDYETTKGTPATSVKKSDFAKIFAGLGYPDMSVEEAKKYYDDEYDNTQNLKYMPYDAVDQAYVHSTLATNATVNYMSENTVSLDYAELSYVFGNDKITVVSLDTTKSSDVAGDGGAVGGDWTDLLDMWLNAESTFAGMNTSRVISMSHHNILEHFTFEELYLSDYIVKGWERAVDTLLGLGVDYHFSGHIHANDVASYVDYAGRTIYDLTTPSVVSHGAGYKVNELKYFSDGASDINTTTYDITDADYSLLFNEGYLNVENYNDEYDDILSNGKVSNVSEYAYVKMLEDISDKMLSQYITKNSINELKTIVKDLLRDYVEEEPVVKCIYDNIDQIVDNVISEINNKGLADYKYKGDKESLQGNDNKLYAIIYEMAEEIVDKELVSHKGEEYTVQDTILYAYSSYLKGDQAVSLEYTPEWFEKAMKELLDGEAIRDIFSELKEDYYPHLQTLLSLNMDLTTNIPSDAIAIIDNILKAMDMSLGNVSAEKMIALALGFAGINSKKDLSNTLDEYVRLYMTDSYADVVGIGIREVILSLATDTSKDGVRGESLHVKYKDSDSHSVGAAVRTGITPSISDGRLPSMLTVSFGADVTSTKELVWFTDKRITGTDIQFMKGDNVANFDSAKAKKLSGNNSVILYDYAVNDLGIALSSNYKQLARHNVSLTGLQADTSYLYRVGDSARGYWSDIYMMKTASSETNKPFEVLLLTDMQTMFDYDSEQNNKLLTASSKVFGDNGYDFVVSMGDFVGNGESMRHWSNALNGSQSVYGNTTQILVNGSKESKNFVAKEQVENVLGRYNTLDLHINQQKTYGNNYYSFDYSGVHFVVLDTAVSGEGGLSLSQVDWLQYDLSNAKSDHKVVFMHKGIYTSGPHSGDIDVVNMRKQLSPIFSDYGVDIVFQGYDHVYSESKFINKEGKVVGTGYATGNSINNNNGGVLYVCLGSSGNIFNDYIDNEKVPVHRGKAYQYPRLTNPTFGRLIFDGESISYEGYQYNRANGKVSKISALIPWWASLIIGLSCALVVAVVVIVTILVLKRNKRKALESQIVILDNESVGEESKGESTSENERVEPVETVEEKPQRQAPQNKKKKHKSKK